MSLSSSDPAAIISSAYRELAPVLLRHCCFRRLQREDAEEVVQEAFINVWEYIARGNEIDNMKTFLYKTVNNLIVDDVRKKKREKKVSLDALQEQGFDPGSDDTGSMQSRLEAQKMLLLLRKHMGKKDHDLLRMRYLLDLKPSDIASLTGASPNATSVRLHRMLKKISAYLKNQ